MNLNTRHSTSPWLKAFLILTVLIFSRGVWAQSSCWPEFNSLQSMQVRPLNKPFSFSYRLKSLDGKDLFQTPMRLDGVYDEVTQQLNMKLNFDSDGVSLPYDLYAVMVFQDDSLVAYWDFTEGCKGPGLGFFPRQTFKLPAVKLHGTGTHPLRVLVWGRL